MTDEPGVGHAQYELYFSSQCYINLILFARHQLPRVAQEEELAECQVDTQARSSLLGHFLEPSHLELNGRPLAMV
jgi:hypothetical protein